MKRRSKGEKIQGIQALYAERGKYNCDYGKPVGKWSMPDGDFPYRQRGLDSVLSFGVRTLLRSLAPSAIRIGYGARVVGKENLKELKGKGAISLCNHISPLDVLFVRGATGHYRSYQTVAPFNNKDGLGGAIINHGGVLPFSSNLAAMQNFNDEVQRLLDNGKFVNFYPEQSMWNSYQQPRPMKSGAFHYAVKFNVPVVPIFCTFKRTKNCGIRKLRINVLKPVYPDQSLPKKLREAKMLEAAEREWRECYEGAYNSDGGMPEAVYDERSLAAK